jgi:hypothetical protein
MNTSQRWFPACSLAAGVVLVAAVAAEAAVVTKRLGTGLPPSSSGTEGPQAWAAPVAQPPTIDGRLEEQAWQATRPLVLGKLDRHGEAAPRTEARFLRDSGTLYVGVKLAEPNMAGLKRAVTQHDGPVWEDDSVELFLQPRHDADYYQIVIGASGAIYDRRDRGNPEDWDSKAKAAVSIGKDGWSLEAAIPLAALGVDEQVPTRWRMNIYRNRRAGGKTENQAWSPTLSADYDVPERFGYLLMTPEPPWAGQEKPADGKSGLRVERLGDEEAVLTFDLSDLRKGARIYRASLQCQRNPIEPGDPRALAEIEIYPLSAPYQKGAPPQTEAKPLALLPPWYQSFDMTELVRRWMSGQANHGLYVKKFPGWRIDKTYLDLMYEGQPGDVPAQTSGLKALHRDGQTFLTWREIDDPLGKDEVAWGELKAVLDGLDARAETRYCVYRSDRPITAASLASAELLATVRPLSCWNTNGRNIERPIDITIAGKDYFPCGHWNPFGSATLDGDFGRECPIDRLVIADGKPLARGTGLYVHTPGDRGTAHYAVLTMVDGVANTRDLSPGNVVGPIEEMPAAPVPVLQKELPKMPFFNYAGRRLHYVEWVAGPELSNVPSQYYNWSVAIPESLCGGEQAGPGKTGRVPLELTLHRDGGSYWRTQFRMERESIVLAPHDFPIRSWWYGYHEGAGTLRSLQQGVIRPYTERRLLAFLDWAARTWPVDRNKIIVTGCRGGASGGGALHLGLRHPDVFATVISGHGSPSYADLAVSTRHNGPSEEAKSLQAVFGHPAWALRTENGKTVWEDLDMNRLLAGTPAQADLPLVAITSDNRGLIQQFHRLMLDQGRPLLAEFSWGGTRYIPVTASETFPNAVRLDVRKDHSVLAFSSAAARKTLTGGMGEINCDVTWRDPREGPARYEVLVNCAAHQGGLYDVTLRRPQQFKLAAGRRYRWAVEPLAGQSRSAQPVKKNQSAGHDVQPAPQGTALAAADGLLTLSDVPLGMETKLTVTPE